MATESLTFKIGADTAAFRNQMAAAIKTLGGLTAAFVGVRATVDSFAKAIDMGGRLNDLSSRTGETAGNLAILERAFENAGSSAEKVGPAINKMQKSIQEASEGSKEAVDALGMLGLSAEDLAGKLPLEQMQIIADRIGKISDPTQRAAAAMAVFGKSGGELLPVLRNFSGEIQSARDQLGSLPDILNKSAYGLDTVGDNFAAISKKSTEFAAGLLSEVLPALEKITGSLSTMNAAGAGAVFGQGLKALFADIGNSAKAIGLTVAASWLDVGNSIISTIRYAGDLFMNYFKTAASDLIPNIIKMASGGFMSLAGEFNKVLIGGALDVINTLSAVFPQLQHGVQPLIDANAQAIHAAAYGRSQFEAGAKAIKDGFQFAKDITPYIKEDILGAYSVYQQAEEAAKKALEAGGSVPQMASQALVDGIIAALDPLAAAFTSMLGKGQMGGGAKSLGGGGGGMSGPASSPLPDSYFNQELFGPQVTNRQRSQTGRGASYEGAYKSSTDLTVEDIADSFDPVGSAYNDFLDQAAGKDQAGKTKGSAESKMGADKGEAKTSSLETAVHEIRRLVALIEPKLPINILG